MPESTVTSKGQITIPKAVREHLHLEAGDRVYFEVQPDGSVVLRTRNRPLEELFGMLRGARKTKRRLAVAQMNPATLPDE